MLGAAPWRIWLGGDCPDWPAGAFGSIAVCQRCIGCCWHVASASRERSVTHLMQRYEELVTLRITDHERIKTRLQKQGHVILAIDGLQPDVGHEVLWVVRDCLSRRNPAGTPFAQ